MHIEMRFVIFHQKKKNALCHFLLVSHALKNRQQYPAPGFIAWTLLG